MPNQQEVYKECVTMCNIPVDYPRFVANNEYGIRICEVEKAGMGRKRTMSELVEEDYDVCAC